MSLLLLFPVYGPIIQVPVHEITISLQAPTLATGKVVEVPVLGLTVTLFEPIAGGGKTVLVPLHEVSLSLLVPVVSTGAAILVPAHEVTLTLFPPGIRRGEHDVAVLRAQAQIYDDWEGIFGFELQGAIDFMPDTMIREEPEGTELTERELPAEPTAAFIENLPYVYTSSE